MHADDIRWTPFTEPLDPLAGIDARDDGWAPVIVRVSHVLVAGGEVLSVALTRLAECEWELAAARRRHVALLDEYRALRVRVLREPA